MGKFSNKFFYIGESINLVENSKWNFLLISPISLMITVVLSPYSTVSRHLKLSLVSKTFLLPITLCVEKSQL